MQIPEALNSYQVGQVCVSHLMVDDQLVRAFAKVTGDHNPIHLDEDVARTSRFGQRIAHGGILFGMISKVLGMDMPGVGTVYLSQSCTFKRPVFLGDSVTLEATIVELLAKDRARISTVITNQVGEVVLDGMAEVKLPGWLFGA